MIRSEYETALAETAKRAGIAVAYHRRVRGIGMVVTVTLLLGWTLIGWAVALAMSFTSNVKPS